MARHFEIAAVVVALGAVGAGCDNSLPNTLPPQYGSGSGTGGGGGGGGAPPSNTDPETAQGQFETMVYPSLMDTCGECHVSPGSGVPYFLAATPPEAYAAVKALPGYVTAPGNSRIMVKGAPCRRAGLRRCPGKSGSRL